MKTVTIKIDKKGQTKVELDGFHGQGCDKIARDFVGNGKVSNFEHKPEFYQTNEAAEEQKQ